MRFDIFIPRVVQSEAGQQRFILDVHKSAIMNVMLETCLH